MNLLADRVNDVSGVYAPAVSRRITAVHAGSMATRQERRVVSVTHTGSSSHMPSAGGQGAPRGVPLKAKKPQAIGG